MNKLQHTKRGKIGVRNIVKSLEEEEGTKGRIRDLIRVVEVIKDKIDIQGNKFKVGRDMEIIDRILTTEKMGILGKISLKTGISERSNFKTKITEKQKVTTAKKEIVKSTTTTQTPDHTKQTNNNPKDQTKIINQLCDK